MWCCRVIRDGTVASLKQPVAIATKHVGGKGMIHRCTDEVCPSVGQRTSSSCGCHQTDEQVLREVNRTLLAALHEGRRAIGDHFAPNDCYATGPLTGDPIRDLVECPACSFIAMYDAALSNSKRTDG